MRKNLILEEIKKEIQEKIALINFENLEVKQEEIRKLFDFLQSLDKLPFESYNNPQQLEENTVNQPILDKTATNEESHFEEKTDKESVIGKVFRFDRKLRGGLIPDLDGGYIIPEKMVRDMNADDGDLVRVISERDGTEQKLYNFELVEKSNVPNTSRVELRFCKVEKEAGELIVRESQGRMIKLDEVPYTFILREGDKLIYHLDKGDIVDIAYYKANPMTMKVIYKYEIEEPLAPTSEQKRLISNARKDKGILDEKTELQYPVDLALFQNKRVLIVGGENRHADYIDVFDSLNIGLETMTGNEGEKRLGPSINRADVVVIVIGEARHAASIQTVKWCKEKGKPFATTYENGIQSVLLCVEEAIKKGVELNLFGEVS